MLGNHLYGSAMSSPYVHQFVPTLHFPLPHFVKKYRVELKSWVEGNLTDCGRSVFIFDEMEKMPPGLIDVLEPFLGPNHVVFRTNYRKAIYVFISTTGEKVINKVTEENRQAGREREEIRLTDLQDDIAQTLYNHNTSESPTNHFKSTFNIASVKSVNIRALSKTSHLEKSLKHLLPVERRCNGSHVFTGTETEMCQTGSRSRGLGAGVLDLGLSAVFVSVPHTNVKCFFQKVRFC
ncbi:prosalusin [Solea senegalensis]|uniref:Prosalusin n=1 Tax=Solea senegalensis TaxID=28829 RepID=A0AAV6QDQ9_SOLSE|nr:prosalusin [Solea senegalensis]